jgi:hypothetical protein
MSVASRMFRGQNSQSGKNSQGRLSSENSTITSVIPPLTPVQPYKRRSTESQSPSSSTSLRTDRSISKLGIRDVEAEQQLAAHDFFHNYKVQHDIDQEKERLLTEARRRVALREQALQWKKEGMAQFHQVEKKVGELRLLLLPHQLFREAMHFLVHFSASARARQRSFPHTPQYRSVSRAILIVMAEDREDTQARRRRLSAHRYSIRIELVFQKMAVLRELRSKYQETFLPVTCRYYIPNKVPELTIVRQLFRLFMQYIPISLSIRETLRKKRDRHQRAVEKMKRIKDTQHQCSLIPLCNSFQHYNPKGCSHCGVIFMGGELKGAIPYVKSLDRDSGIATLVTLEFELQTLAQEEESHGHLLSQISSDLHTFEEEEVFIHVRSAIQQWWGFVLAFKRRRKDLTRLKKSLYYYRIRRLSKLKQEIDIMIKEPQPIDMNYCCDKYCDVIPELVEYVALQQELKDCRLKKYCFVFTHKLKELVLEAEERRRLERLRLLSLPKPVPPIRIKSLRPLSPHHLMCVRSECNRRTFLTKDRFDTHMSMHKQQDEIRYAKYELDRQQKLRKESDERSLLNNMQRSKEFIAQSCGLNEAPRKPLLNPKCDSIELTNKDISVDSNVTTFVTRTDSAKAVDDELDELLQQPQPWTALPHRYQIYSLFNSATFFLELVSKHSSITCPSRFVLDSAVVRVGTHASCELKIGISSAEKEQSKISKIHCLFYHGMATTGHENSSLSHSHSNQQRDEMLNTVTMVDNHSVFGCYVVGCDGALKVPSKITRGIQLANGNMICIGVCKDGPPLLPVTEASNAMIVYRLQISNMLSN